jgi:P-type Cu+ transporter
MAAFVVLLGIYFVVLTLVSGWQFTVSQFSEFWYYVVALAVGFGLQVALFVRLRQAVSSTANSKAMMATSGTTPTAAMISCCAHFLVNVAPVLGAT